MRSPRAVAAVAIAAVIGKGAALGEALNANLGRLADRDRALARDIAFGVCRHYFELDGVLQQLLSKPLKQKDADIHALLLAGMYQLRYMRVPDHAAVAESVAATQQLGKRWASGLVNAILRGFQSRGETVMRTLDESQRVSHPHWLLQRIRAAWPEQCEQIIAANNEAPEMTLRVHGGRTSRDAWLARAAAEGIAAHAGELSDAAVILERALDVERLPGFAEGLVSVQDQSAQLAAPLLRAQPMQRVLDACSAPGGKTCHLLERLPLQLTSLDSNAKRLQRVHENLQRLGLEARVVTGDACEPLTWWDGIPFDRILLDAPCSATGVIRRHPDIRILRSSAQVEHASALQLTLLSRLWDCLAPDGLLLYCTCSILPQENDGVIEAFLSSQPRACVEPIDAAWGIATSFGRQLLPRSGSNDGFYYALLRNT